MSTLIERLTAAAGEADRLSWTAGEYEVDANGRDKALAALALELSHIVRELEEGWVPADANGQIPTNAQAFALGKVIRSRWAGDVAYHLTVAKSPFGLPNDYIGFSFVDGYTGGIDREGRVST